MVVLAPSSDFSTEQIVFSSHMMIILFLNASQSINAAVQLLQLIVDKSSSSSLTMFVGGQDQAGVVHLQHGVDVQSAAVEHVQDPLGIVGLQGLQVLLLWASTLHDSTERRFSLHMWRHRLGP